MKRRVSDRVGDDLFIEQYKRHETTLNKQFPDVIQNLPNSSKGRGGLFSSDNYWENPENVCSAKCRPCSITNLQIGLRKITLVNGEFYIRETRIRHCVILTAAAPLGIPKYRVHSFNCRT